MYGLLIKLETEIVVSVDNKGAVINNPVNA
jgi:hypothetical protein